MGDIKENYMHWTRFTLAIAILLALGILGSQVVNAQASGGTYPGPFYLGSTEAPVVLEEYADFQ
jgi:hypothetical protein